MGGLYRPPQWVGPAMVSITVTPTTTSTSTVGATDPMSSVGGATDPFAATTAPTTYVFDAVVELNHEQRLEKTHHPVQTGADISSHAYLMPARVSLNVGMSDAMAAYSSSDANNTATSSGSVSPFTGGLSKSVSAYQTMLALQASRQPLIVTTRLRTYTNMVITSVAPREDYRTITGLRMRVEFEEILTGSASTVAAASARTDATQTSDNGQVNPVPVPTSTQNQFQQPQRLSPGGPSFSPSTYSSPTTGISGYPVNTPGAGSYSSVPGQTGAAQ